MSLGDDIAASYSEDERRAANSAIVAAYRANGIIGAKMASLTLFGYLASIEYIATIVDADDSSMAAKGDAK